MGFLFRMDLFLGEKGFWQKKVLKVFSASSFTYWTIYRSGVFFCLVELSFLDLDCLYIVAAIPHRRRIGGGREVGVVTRSCGSLQGLWCRWQDLLQYLEEVGVVTWYFFKLSRVRVHLAGLVAIPGGSWGGDQVFWKLLGIGVQVAGLVATPGASWGEDQVLWKLSGAKFR